MERNFKHLLIGILFLLITNVSIAHNTGSIKGTVTDKETGLPLPGVNVYIEESIIGTVTDINGNYSLKNVQIGEYKLVFSFVSYEKLVKDIVIKENETTTLNVVLQPQRQTVSEVSVFEERPFSAASSKEIRKIDLQIRPNRSAQDMLQMVPGLVIAQHAGGGKAEQIFIRGFDCDHGTDVAINVDEMPVNMVSHGHGQGYADLHFLIPETVDELTVEKGTYFAEHGDFATAGAVSFKTKDILKNNEFKVEAGEFNTQKATLLYQVENGGVEQNAYFAAQYYHTDGPFKSPQEFQRFNVFGKYFSQLSHNSKITVTASSFSSAWNASGQIPERAVKNGIIDRFDGIDNLEGGTTGRQNLNLKYTFKSHNGGIFDVQSYMSSYNFKLFSNFTLYLEDSINGDMIEQYDNRILYGMNAKYKYATEFLGINTISTYGCGYRADNIDVQLWHSPDRIRMNPLVVAEVQQRNIYGFAQEQFNISKRFKIIAGLRGDYFTFNVNDLLGNAYTVDSTGLPHASGYSQNAMLNPKLNFNYKLFDNIDIFINSGSGFHSNDARANIIGEKAKELEKIMKDKGYSSTQIDSILLSYNFDPALLHSTPLPRATGGELGLRMRLFNNRLHLGVAMWYLYMEKEFVYVGDGGTTELSDPTERKGVDFESRYMIKPWLWADIDLCVSEGIIKNLPDGENYIPLAPTVTSTGGISIVHPSGIEASLRYKMIADRPGNEDNSVTAYGYQIFNAYIAYKYKQFKVFGTIENILDSEWNEAQFSTETRLQNELTPVTELCYTPGNPRNLRFGISFEF